MCPPAATTSPKPTWTTRARRLGTAPTPAPGWQAGYTFTQGLHPSTDVFDDPQDELYKAQNPDSGEACDKADPPSPPPLDVDLDAEVPTSAARGTDMKRNPTKKREISPEECDKGEPAGFPEPVGAPPPLTAQQRARLHAILQTRDPDGKVPYGLDNYTGDAAKWAAYRRAVKASYRAHRKRKRADGTWEKDDYRGWGPLQHREPRGELRSRDRQPLPRLRERSPLPRRRDVSRGDT